MEQHNYKGALQHPIGSGFNAKSTAADVIKGIDLRGRIVIVTGVLELKYTKKIIDKEAETHFVTASLSLILIYIKKIKYQSFIYIFFLYKKCANPQQTAMNSKAKENEAR